MGYSPCKMVTLGQKLKMLKRCEKSLCDYIRLVVWKKPLQKTPNIRKMRDFSKLLKLATMHGLQPMQNGQFGSKIKNARKVRKKLVRPLNSSCVQKNCSKKHLIFEKWEHFENCQNWPPCMNYSPCKMVSLVQKLKMRKTCEKSFYDHIRVVVCKKPLQKSPNIRKMRTC